MRTSVGILGAALIMVALAVSSAVTLVAAAAPYLLLAAVVFAVARAAGHRGRPPAVERRPGRRPVPSPRPVDAGRWVLVSVWVAPDQSRRSLPVLDAEVIADGRPRR
ncbi:hypothetical protein CIW49_26950 [Mycolicibacterium sp. P1-18]|uniref:hypothetical protein n=1 Tax=Mycolicibacterium sp. P1-18 TaxID=2024615 RepID=UPI0011F1F51D|nr:hypothetical protein [Mycolicibacterium sp. P1-18]KAA0093682.1 hypothetical protein CIW49_26950 [Mycolicibacterium sp. P1-18]